MAQSTHQNSLNPKPTQSLTNSLCIVLHPSTFHHTLWYLTRNYLTLKGNVLESEYSSLQLLEKLYFPAKAPLERQKEMERMPLPVKAARLEAASTRGYDQSP